MKKILFSISVMLCVLSIILSGNVVADENTLVELEENLSKCVGYEDYEKYAEEIKKKIAKDPTNANAGILYYNLAKVRLEELAFLAKRNDIESVRFYMKVSEPYHNEALTSLDEALRITKSKRLMLDTLLLKFLIYKEKFDAEKEAILSNEIAKIIANFSDDHNVNKRELNRISYELKKKGFPQEGLKIKALYAEKAPRQYGIEVAEDIKKKAAVLFEEGNFKESNVLYKHYFDIARKIFEKNIVAFNTLEIADKYFNRKKYTQALRYYREYIAQYPDFKQADYCVYKIGLCLYFGRNYAAAIQEFNNFLREYPESKWFNKGFESLCRIYYEESSHEKAVEKLQMLIEAYSANNIRQFAEFLIGFLYYDNAEYDKALRQFRELKNNYPDSVYVFAVETLVNDIKNISKGTSPAFASIEDNIYNRWEPYTPIMAKIISELPGEGKTLEKHIVLKPGGKIEFSLDSVKDFDKRQIYLYDKEDHSRLPRKIDEKEEADLLSITWIHEGGGHFLSKEQGLKKTWQAPGKSGTCKVSVSIDDLALVRPPDEGIRKDFKPWSFTVMITVKE